MRKEWKRSIRAAAERLVSLGGDFDYSIFNEYDAQLEEKIQEVIHWLIDRDKRREK